jgi:chromosomal replication initiation ATPase DnaA
MSSKKELFSPYVIPGLKRESISKEKYPFMMNPDRTMLSKEEILKIIAEESGITVENIFSDKKKTEMVFARHIYAKIQKLNGRNLVQIAKELNKDHTTIIHSLRAFDDRYNVYDEYRESANKIFNKIGLNSKFIENEYAYRTSKRS